MSTFLNVASRNAALAAYVTAWGGSCIVELWNGTRPAALGAPSGTKLATLNFGSAAITDANGGSAGGVSAGVLTFGGYTQTSSGHVSGTPTFVRIKKSDASVQADIDVGGGAGSIAFSGSVVANQNVTGPITFTADITLPGGAVIQLPAEPFYAVAVTEGVSLATTVAVTLTTDGTTPVANQTGLKWAFWDQVNPSAKLAPTAKGSAGAVTGGNGTFSVSIVGTALTTGQVGWLEVTNSDGTPGQNPSGKIASGPVTTS